MNGEDRSMEVGRQVSAQDLVGLVGLVVPEVVPEATWTERESPTELATLWEGELFNPIRQTPVPCLMYRPRNGEPNGAVVAIHQHNDEYQFGKGEPAGLMGSPDAAYGLAMANRGWTVLMPDLECFESRRGVTGDDVKYELFMALNAVARGGSLHARYVQDVLTAVRYLEQHEVAGAEVAVIGHSLGGQIAFLTLAIDERVKTGVVSCGLTTYDACRENHIVHNPGWYIPGLDARGGYPAIARAIHGKKILATAAMDDIPFPAKGAREVQEAFNDGVVETAWRDGPHELNKDALNDMTDWLAGANQ